MESSSGQRAYSAVCLTAAALLPGMAAVATVILYLWDGAVFQPGPLAPFIGTAAAVFLWLISSLFFRHWADAKYAIPSSYGELQQRLVQLKAQINDMKEPSTAKSQALGQIEQIERDFLEPGLNWTLARGYINAWSRLHRAEEALIEAAPAEVVVTGALSDMLRLQGSMVAHADDLLCRLREAVVTLEPDALKYLETALPLTITTPAALPHGTVSAPYAVKLMSSGGTPPVHWSLSQSSLPAHLELTAEGMLSGTPQAPTTGAASFTVRAVDSANMTATRSFSLTVASAAAAAATDAADATSGTPSADAATETAKTGTPGDPSNQTRQHPLARSVMRDVRNAINEFRDHRWNGLIVARNRLIATMVFTGLMAHLLLSIAVIRGATRTAITAATTFYLVGAIVGLLNQLKTQSQNDSALEDYGLSTARLITIPLLCGLAAIGGVVLVAIPQMANSSPAASAPLAIATPAQLETGCSEQPYLQHLAATGGNSPYTWSSGATPIPTGFILTPAGDLYGTVPKRSESLRQVHLVAQVKDRYGAAAEKGFFLNLTSANTRMERGRAPAQEATLSVSRPLEDIFDLHKNLFGLVLAGVFGLTPGLLFNRLQQQSEKYKDELKGSEVTQTKTSK